MADTPPMLPYAASLARDRVSVERGPHFLRVISPPVGSWRKISRGYHVSIGLLGLVVLLALLSAISRPAAEDRRAALHAMAIYAGILLLVLVRAYDRVRRSFVFEVTHRTFSMTRLTPWGPLSARTWQRGAIASVSATPRLGMLAVRITGQDRIDVWLGPDPDATEAVAAALRDGLAATAEHAPADRSAGEIVPPEQLPPGPARTTMLVTAFVLGLIGIGVALFVNVYVAMIPLVLAGIPAGLALGTQKKDYYQ